MSCGVKYIIYSLLVFVVCLCFIISVHCLTSFEQMSTENINEILDTLILQTQQINDSTPTEDIKELTSVDETPPVLTSNDSNIYYFKTFMAPHINFKSSNEVVHGTQDSNNTIQSLEVSNNDHDPNSEDKLFPGSSKITRKTTVGVTNKKEFTPRLLHGTTHSEFKARSGKVEGGVNEHSLEKNIKKDIVAELSTTKENKQISLTQSAGHNNQQLSLLHNYPEIIIDHITFDNDENDNSKPLKTKSSHETQHVGNIVKGEVNKTVPIVQPRKNRYNIPEEDIEVEDHDHAIPQYIEARNYLTSEMKGVIDAVIQKKATHDALLKQTTESESRKQSMLLEKILQRLPEKRQMMNNVQSSYAVRHERIAPVDMETLSRRRSSLDTVDRNGGNRLTNSYLKVPYVPSKWEIHNRLLRTLVHLFRPDVLKRTRVVAGLIDRIVPNIDYQPVYYDLYKK